jgi:aspartyl-tRNA synthetase
MSKRIMGGASFCEIQDSYGKIQIYIQRNSICKDENKDLYNIFFKKLIDLGDIIGVDGYVFKTKLGEISIHVENIAILSKSLKPLPCVKDDGEQIHCQFTDKEQIYRNRYLDLILNKKSKEVFLKRSKLINFMRNYFNNYCFLEVETPILTRSTPEGARDYLVPSRVHHGEFYALPQSPQMFKQTLMASGIDRYFQLARCFRDEDLRADRQPEHTQIDMEMSFVTIDDIHHIVEGLMQEIFKTAGKELKTPFIKLPFDQAMERFGSDKPDLRYSLDLKNAADVFAHTGFKVFADVLSAKGVM